MYWVSVHLAVVFKLRNQTIDLFTSLILLIFRKSLSRSQLRLLNIILRAQGFNNFQNSHESGEKFFIEEILAHASPKICIDIGANQGDYSKELLSKTNAKVIAFEPLLGEYSKLVSRLSIYGDRFTGINMGLGSKTGKDFIYYNPNATTHASYTTEIQDIDYISNDFRQEVNTTTLDDFVESNKISSIDLIKIDVEGYEKEVFVGAVKTLQIYKPKYVQIEMNWHQMFRGTSLLYFSKQLPNYKLFQLLKDGWIQRNPMDPLVNLYLYSNFVFVRDEKTFN